MMMVDGDGDNNKSQKYLVERICGIKKNKIVLQQDVQNVCKHT